MYYSIESKATQISDPQVVSHIILHITVHNGTYASKKLVFSSCTTDGNTCMYQSFASKQLFCEMRYSSCSTLGYFSLYR